MNLLVLEPLLIIPTPSEQKIIETKVDNQDASKQQNLLLR